MALRRHEQEALRGFLLRARKCERLELVMDDLIGFVEELLQPDQIRTRDYRKLIAALPPGVSRG